MHGLSTRASDEERGETIGLLHDHLLAGRLDSDELEDRVGEAWAARTLADLDHALRELPPRWSPPPARIRPTFVRRGPAITAGGIAFALGVMGLAALLGSLGLLVTLALVLLVL